jgi:GntR family transcriptional repressor for pyruvate dehydrogenase complex
MSLAKTKEKVSLTERITQKLLSMINGKELLVGEKLPSENELCTMFGASRTSVRAALQKLQGRGVISTIQGVGSFVKRADDLQYSEQGPHEVSRKVTLSSEEFKEFFEFRQAIEFRSIDFFVRRASAEDKQQLQAAIDGIRLAGKKGDRDLFNKMDYEFHMAVIKGSRNHLFYNTMQEHGVMFRHYLSEITNVTDKHLTVLVKEHEKLFNLLMDKKAKEAKEFLFADNMYYWLAYFNKWLDEVK